MKIRWSHFILGAESFLPLAVAYAVLHGAIGLFAPWFEPSPHNDDWVYAFSVRHLVDGDGLVLHPLAAALALPQIVAGWGVCELAGGFSFRALRATMVVAGIVPVWLVWKLLRQLGARADVAAVGTVVFLTNPVLVSLTWSFMTELPFLALVLGACVAEVAAVQSGRLWWWWVASMILLVACLERQAAILLVAAPVLYHLIRWHWSLAALAALPAPLVWWIERVLSRAHGLRYSAEQQQHLWSYVTEPTVSKVLFLGYESLHVVAFLGLVMLPVFALRRAEGKGDATRRGVVSITLLVFLALTLFDAKVGRTVLPGNYLGLVPASLGPLTLHDTWIDGATRAGLPRASATIAIANGFGLLGGALLLARVCGIAFGWWRAIRDRMVNERTLLEWNFALLSLAIVAMSAAAGIRPFDRYVLCLVPLAIPICVPLATSRRWLLVPIIWSVVAAAFSVAGVVDYWRWNEARWRAAGSLESEGVPASEIDGGYEYNGLRFEGDLEWTPSRRLIEAVRGEPRREYRIQFAANAEPDDGVRRFGYRTPLSAREQFIEVVRPAQDTDPASNTPNDKH